MRPTLAALCLAVVACSAPPTGAPPGERIVEPGFDAAAWIAAVEATDDPAALVALSESLLDAVDWRVACGEDDPTAQDRGLVAVHHLEGGAALAEVTCQAYAYQTAFALVDARAGRPPRLVRARLIDDDGAPSENTTESYFGILTVGEDPGTFGVVTLDAPDGGCGVAAAYRLRPDGSAAIVRTRAHADCGAPLAPETWPVVFEAE